MARWHWLSLSALAGLLACQSLQVRGGSSISVEAARLLSVETRYRPLRCEDARGGIVRVPDEVLELVPSGTESALLLRTGESEAWLISDSFREGNERVFQLSLEGQDGLWLLRDIRLGADGGRMAYVGVWSEERRDGHLRAHFDAARMTCELARLPAPRSTAAGP